MPRYAGAAIHTLLVLMFDGKGYVMMNILPKVPGLSFVVGDEETLALMQDAKTLVPFSDEAIRFLDALSQILFKKGRAYSDVVTFAFWCRKGSLMREKKKYETGELRFGRGITFHSTPSNVAVNFAFSFAAGLLAGNPNVVRLPAKAFEQVNVISTAVREVLLEQPEMRPYVVFVKYGLIQEFSDYFSSICMNRIVWGGDMTIALMRKSPLPPRAVEVTFADRYSLAVFKAESILALDEAGMKTLARNFWNDTYFTDQNACTSPRLIAWVGEGKGEAKAKFWSAVHEIVKAEYAMQPVQSVGKLAAFYRAAASVKGLKLIHVNDNLITRVQVETFTTDLMNWKYNSGFFYELDAGSLDEVFSPTSVKCQTVTQFGLTKDEMEHALLSAHPGGIDRIVPVGASMNFALTWDGYDLIRTLSRVVNF